jgi:sortase A
VIGAVGRLMIRAGVLVLLLVVYQLWGTGIHTTEAQDNLRRQFSQEQAAQDTTPTTSSTPTTTAPSAPTPAADGSIPVPKPGDPIGTIDIPRIGSNFVMVEGVELKYLSEGPGHFPGTPLPGQAGNAAVAGHRTTYKAPFNRIDELQPGDEIFITTLQGHFTYKVMAQAPAQPGGPALGHRVVKPNAVEILADKGRNQLTLMACNPKYYATQRIVVEALLVGNPVAGKPAGHAANVNQDALAGLTKGDNSERVPATAWLLAALAVWFLTWLASHTIKVRRDRAVAAAAAANRGVAGAGGPDPWSTDGSGVPGDPGPGGGWGATSTATLAPPAPPPSPPSVASPPSAASWWLRWTPYVVGFPIFIVLLYASFEAFSKVLPGAF